MDAALLGLAPEHAKAELLETMREAAVFDETADRLWQTFEHQAMASGRMARHAKQALDSVHKCKAAADKTLGGAPAPPAHPPPGPPDHWIASFCLPVEFRKTES